MNTVGGEETAHAVESVGGEAIAVRTDVSEPAEVEALLAAKLNRYGRLDCAFNQSSDAASFVNGAALPVDGGFLAQ